MISVVVVGVVGVVVKVVLSTFIIIQLLLDENVDIVNVSTPNLIGSNFI